jgi:hypothetical protein
MTLNGRLFYFTSRQFSEVNKEIKIQRDKEEEERV